MKQNFIRQWLTKNLHSLVEEDKDKEIMKKEYWLYIAQVFVGLFFIGGAMFKIYNYKIIGDQTLTAHFDFWISSNWSPKWFASLMEMGKSHEDLLEWIVIAMQSFAGFFLVINIYIRQAGIILFLVQLPIFIGTLKHLGFNEFVGISLWIALIYAFNSPPRRRTSAIFTILLVILAGIQLYNRFTQGDHLFGAIDWQREHLAADVMSISVFWKNFVLNVSETTWGRLLWTGGFWIQGFLTVMLFTKWRLKAGAILLLIWLFHDWTWTNSVTSQGVLWLLTYFVWVTQEECIERKSKPRFLLKELLW